MIMADILIHSASMTDGKAVELDVELHGLGKRTIDRATAIAWMRDGHSLIPLHQDSRAPALRLGGQDDDPCLHAVGADGEGDVLGDLTLR